GNVTTIFGDISDPEVLEKANVKKAKLIISTVTDLDDNLVLIAESKRAGKARLVVVANDEDEAKELYRAGADLVVVPHLVGGDHIATLLDYGLFTN
ncbi:NAD-binding protein, partial [Candidatus Microgenomates bacterium]|nr:NAD-binding protein [Candidatus Microgenomates bacterium]